MNYRLLSAPQIVGAPRLSEAPQMAGGPLCIAQHAQPIATPLWQWDLIKIMEGVHGYWWSGLATTDTGPNIYIESGINIINFIRCIFINTRPVKP